MNSTIIKLIPWLMVSQGVFALEFSGQGQVQASWQQDDDNRAWYNEGWGNTRFGKGESDILLNRAVLDWRVDAGSSWSVHGVTQYQPDPDDKLGFTELYLQYRTLPNNGIRWSARVGGFYPKFSIENPDIGWSSPYTYHYSAINAWMGEEVRAFGGEVNLEKPKTRRSRGQGWKTSLGVFKGNDPAGTLLAWRGFAIHDRQTVFNERIAFAGIAALNAPQLANQAQFDEPFTEVDGRFGYYLGYHRQVSVRQEFNVYWYDNNGDPAAVNYKTGQYAWDSKFLSVAWRYKLTPETQLLVQGLSGNTAMGPRRGVDNDFHSWFALLSHRWQQFRFSARVEQFKVIDKDTWQFDPNQSDGKGITLSLRYEVTQAWQLGAEWLYVDSMVANRTGLGAKVNQTEQVWRLGVDYRFHL
ncbi:hypothetical protein ACSLBF_00555 [Pseudoalteromonas sp. T1lg65]|uniref:hypothetical protein n=1 Tax=Pseudoalteromonas sp. T1lg65 TaxID=2077101 RepID=UPI003F791F70